MILLVGFYRDPDEYRHGEFLECLRRNAENDHIDEIHVFIEDSTSPAQLMAWLGRADGQNVQAMGHGRRLDYLTVFTYANRFCQQQVIVANADIYFDQTLARLGYYDLSGRLLCLSRWDQRPDGSALFFDHPASQDAWIFTPPLPPFPCAFQMGVPSCDNRLAWEAERIGIAISNPSRSVRAHHLHLSGVRRYTEQERLGGPTRCVPATALPPLRETIFALTSLHPDPQDASHTRECIASWRRAGLHVCAFNHASEIPKLACLYDVDLIPVNATSADIFGAHFVPICEMLRWAHERDAPVLLINSDILLDLDEWEFKRIRWLSRSGLCYCVRHNHAGDLSSATREVDGIDAFLLHGRDVPAFEPSFLSMGQPFWDYWLPHAFSRNDKSVYSVEFPVAYHRSHAIQWTWPNWRRCALEFVRITDEFLPDPSYEMCVEMSKRIRRQFDEGRISLAPSPGRIKDWVQAQFAHPRPKTFLELGAHQGTDTAWMALLPNVTIHAFEPDPRNDQEPRPNLVLNRAAIADRDGPGSLILSKEGWGREWTYSSSIKLPKNHLQRYPVTFGEEVPVEYVTLDTYCAGHHLDVIDFIWADIQGAEREMILGGIRTLARTQYLFTEYSDDELYEDQPTLQEILRLLPDFRVVELWPDDVLLENTRFERSLAGTTSTKGTR
jgi:FkbM family methyltransferase